MKTLAMRKFIKTITTEPVPLPKEHRTIITLCLKDLSKQIPKFCVTGLATKARVKLASTSCYEANRKEGGTPEAIRMLLM